MSDETHIPDLTVSDESFDATDPEVAAAQARAVSKSSRATTAFLTPHGHGRRAYVTQEIVDTLDALRGDGRKTMVIDGSTRSDS